MRKIFSFNYGNFHLFICGIDLIDIKPFSSDEMNFPIIIDWESPLYILGAAGVVFNCYSIFNEVSLNK